MKPRKAEWVFVSVACGKAFLRLIEKPKVHVGTWFLTFARKKKNIQMAIVNRKRANFLICLELSLRTED